jgi:signal transduction histidine kinase
LGAVQVKIDALRGLRIDIETSDLPPLSAATEIAAYRIIMEALTNVVRHSGATHADIVLRVHNDTLEVTVVDNGAGTGEWVPGIGLTSMRERANELGGSLSHHPSPSGSTVTATLPLGTPGGADAHSLDSG